MKRKIVKRVCSDVLMIVLIAWAPWWIIVIAAGVFLFVYNSYYEIIIWGLCLDELYGAAYHIPYSLVATIIACGALVAAHFLKKSLLLYK